MGDGIKVHHPPWPFFSWIEAWEIKTRGREAYETVAADPEQYATLNALMEKFFVNPIEMFPDAQPGEGGSIRMPREFFEIQAELIANRFPGAQGEFGDADIRDLISEFRSVFWRNIVKFVISKKLILLLAGAAPILACLWAALAPTVCDGKSPPGFCSDLPLSPLTNVAAGLAVIAVSLGAFHFVNGQLFRSYRERLTISASKVSHGTSMRTKQLAKLFGELHFNVEDRRSKLVGDRRRDWPKEAGRWTVMAYWISQRLDYLERFIQIEMWRIRRAHYFVNRGGLILTWVIGLVLAGSLTGLLVAAVLRGGLDERWPFLIELALAAAASGYMTWLSYAKRDWRTPLSFVSGELHPNDWERYSGLQLHTKLFEQAEKDKQERNEADDKLKR